MSGPEVLSSRPEPDEPRLTEGGWITRMVRPVAVIVLLFGLLCGYAGYRLGRADPVQGTDEPPRQSGVRLVAADWFGDNQDPPLGRVVVQLNVTNHGSRRVQVLAAGTSYPGLTITRTEFVVASGVSRNVPSPPFTLEPRGTVGVLLTYRVTDCTAATSGRLPLPVQILDRGKPQTIDVGSPRTYDGPWQSGFLTSVCPGAASRAHLGR